MQWLIPGTDSMIAYVVIFAATVLEFILLPAPGGPLPLNLGGFGSGSWGRSLVFTSPLQGRLCVTRILQIDARLKVLRRDYRAVLPSLWNSDPGFFDVLSGCEPFRSAPRRPSAYPSRSFFFLDLLGGFLGAGVLVVSRRVLGPHIPVLLHRIRIGFSRLIPWICSRWPDSLSARSEVPWKKYFSVGQSQGCGAPSPWGERNRPYE